MEQWLYPLKIGGGRLEKMQHVCACNDLLLRMRSGGVGIHYSLLLFIPLKYKPNHVIFLLKTLQWFSIIWN